MSTMEQKKSYLDILAVFHYVNGGLHLLITLLAMGGVGIGLAAVAHEGEWMPAGCILLAVIGFLFVVLGGYSVLNLLTGRALQTRTHYLLAMLTSGVNCLNVPLGTILGIVTLVQLADPEVKALFDRGGEPEQPLLEGD